MFEQQEFKVKVGSREQRAVERLTFRFDKIISKNFYLPIQASVAHGGNFGYPGYGELLLGVGMQSAYAPGNRFQHFAQMLAGTNVLGATAKIAAGTLFSLSEQLALHGQVGATFATTKGRAHPGDGFKPFPTVGLGLSYRFSLAG